MRGHGHDAQRRFARLPFNRPAELAGPNGAVDGRLRDIGLNGARLTLHGGWAGGPGARYRLRATLAPGTEVCMELTLVYCQGSTAGFRCQRIDGHSLANLKRLLALHYGDRSAIEAEVARLHAIEEDS